MQELASTCAFMGGAAQSLSGDHRRPVFTVLRGGQLFHLHLATGDGPFVVLLAHERAVEHDPGPARTSTLVCSRSSRTICSCVEFPGLSTISAWDRGFACRLNSEIFPGIQACIRADCSIAKQSCASRWA